MAMMRWFHKHWGRDTQRVTNRRMKALLRGLETPDEGLTWDDVARMSVEVERACKNRARRARHLAGELQSTRPRMASALRTSADRHAQMAVASRAFGRGAAAASKQSN